MGRRKNSARAEADATARAAALSVAGVPDPDVPIVPDFEFEVDPVVEAARERLERRRSGNAPQWHSLTPRLMVLLSILGTLGSWLALLLLFGNGDVDPQNDVLSDEQMRQWKLVGAAFAVSITGGWLGAVWWAFAAAKNTRRVSPAGPSPITPIVFYVIFPVGAYLGMYYSSSRSVDLALYYGYIAFFVIGYLVLTLGFRNSARKIGAPPAQWTALLAIPLLWMGANLSLTMLFKIDVASGGSSGTVVALALGASALAMAAYIMSIGRAMATYDRACRQTRGTRDPNQEEALMNNLLAFHQRNLGIAPEDMFLPEPVS